MIHTQKSRPAAAVVTAVILLTASATLRAKEWQAWVGMPSRDGGSQALAFLPNELWVHTADSIRWTLTATEIHTVTFLQQTPGQPGQVRPPFFSAFLVQTGCPGMPATPDGSSFDGSTCVNSGVMGTFDTIVGPQSYSVKFPKAGNFKFVCFVHFDMTGSIHSKDDLAHVIYPGGVSKDDWVHDLPLLINETWTRRAEAVR